MVSFTEAIKICTIKKFATISGRATRAEYWWFQLFFYLVIFLLILIGIPLEHNGGEIFLTIAVIFYFIMIIPNFCSRIRRLHDGGHSGWYLLWGCVPYVGWIIVLIAELQGSDSDNEYGPDPTNPYANNVYYQQTKTNVNDREQITDVDL